MVNFGKGPTLKEASRFLKDDRARIEQILRVAEINSVIEGLPPFGEEMRQRLRDRLTRLSAPGPTQPE